MKGLRWRGAVYTAILITRKRCQPFPRADGSAPHGQSVARPPCKVHLTAFTVFNALLYLISMRKGRILVVGEEHILEQLYQLILASAGYEHDSFSDAEKALSFLTAHHARVDLALIDVPAPRLKNNRLVKRIAAIDPGLPIIIITAGQTRQANGSVRAILKKPFLGEDLLQAVQEHRRHAAGV